MRVPRRARMAPRSQRRLMMRKLVLVAALFVGTCGMAIAQGGAGSEPPKASDANPPAATRAIPGEAKSAPIQTSNVAMKKKKKKKATSMAPTNSKNRAQGSETGSAKDSAGPAGMRAAPGSGNMT